MEAKVTTAAEERTRRVNLYVREDSNIWGGKMSRRGRDDDLV